MAIKVTFLIRRDTAANWTTVNPILRTGEPAIETDTRRIKYGNGVDSWNDLDYASVPMPAGGTTLQVLKKYSGNDFEFSWEDNTAGTVSFTPVGTISATDVQGAIAELAAEKVQGPGASTDQALVRWNGTGGFSVLSSGVILDGSDNITGVATLEVDDDAYGAGWNGSLKVPTKNAIWDKIETVAGGNMPTGGTAGQIIIKVDSTNYNVAWGNLTAGIVSFTPTGTIAATTVQGAIAELEAEKIGGPGASTDNAITRWNGTAGFLVQSSGVIIDDSDNVTGATSLEVDDDAYGAGWNGSLLVPTKNALYDKIEAIVSGGANALIQDTGTYVEVKDGSGVTTGRLGGTGDPGNYWDNTTHYFRDRAGSSTFVSFSASGFVSNVNITVPGDAFGAGWNGSTQVPTKDAIYDKATAQDATIATKLTGSAITNSNALIPSLNSPWINYGGGFGGARYFKDAAGVVHIEGLIQAPGGSPTSGVTLFTLLAGYRPADTMMFCTWNGGGAGRIDVDSAGNVVMQSGNTAFTSLSGISFIPA